MTTYRDFFSSNSDWAEAAGHVDATQAVSGEVMTITAGTDYTTSLWSKGAFKASDCIVVVTLDGASGDPQVHVRETDEDNFLMAWIDSSEGNFIISKRVSGTLTAFQSQAIPNWDSSKDYTIIVKVFGNALHAILLDESWRMLLHNIEVSSDVSDQTGRLLGVGAGSVASYSKYTARSVDQMVNVVCLGDSNTDGNNIDAADEFPWVMNARRAFDNSVFVNSGKAGDNIAQCEARVATEVTPYYVNGHRNVCIMQMGTNDRADGFTAVQSQARYQSCIAAVKSPGFEPFVATGFPNTKGDADNTQWNEDLNDWILANEATYGYTAVPIWEDYGGVEGSGFPPDIDRLWVTENNPHASEAGHLIFTNSFLRDVKNELRSAAASRPAAATRSAASTRSAAQPRIPVS